MRLCIITKSDRRTHCMSLPKPGGEERIDDDDAHEPENSRPMSVKSGMSVTQRVTQVHGPRKRP